MTIQPRKPGSGPRVFEAPPPLTPGDIVDVIAPASPFDRALLFRGLGWLRQHLRVRLCFGLSANRGVTAGSEAYRLQQVNRALASDAKALLAARGGVGCTDIADQIDTAHLWRNPKWLIGFSDVTALHLRFADCGLMSIHAHNATGLGRSDDRQRRRWLSQLYRPLQRARFAAAQCLYSGTASGPLVGGNLTVLCAQLSVGRAQLPRGALLFIEEVGEPAYRIHRCLTELSSLGVFDRVSGLVLGQFTGCSPTRGVTALDILKQHAQRHRLPCIAGFPAGHAAAENTPITLGAPAHMDPAGISVGGPC